ncbi:MAG: glycoside hydrolase family 99-like domain-containing protein [Candidatus Flemingiibacterium sp.]
MYNIKLYDYVPKPDPAESGRIIAAHYYPSWTRGDNGLNHEFEDNFDYPERTPLAGFYEDKNPEVIDWEIKWALEHGVNCWIYCWYRRRDNMGKPMTQESLRLGRGLHEGFLRARYADMMKFAVMFETSDRWGAADRDDLLENVLPFWFREYFSRENYLRIDGKPVVFLYDPQRQLCRLLGGEAGMKEALDACREAARAVGFGGIIFAEQIIGRDDPIEGAKSRGVDFCFYYNMSVGYDKLEAPSDYAYSVQLSKNLKLLASDPGRFVPTVSHFWDAEPRIKGLPAIKYNPKYWYLSFRDYRKLLRAVKALCDAAPVDSIAHKLMMVDNCNEWDEGHFLFPSYRFGFKHLQCIREELTDHENLPDYRMPAELGFGPYDEAWGGRELDLSAHNDRKLDDGEFTHHRYFEPD